MSDDRVTVAKAISEQLHRMLSAKKQQAELVKHNLEKGLGNEQALRDLLRWFLPKRFGIAKGKVANMAGGMSRQLDLIIYDAMNCPTLFIDENENQLLPVEGVYSVVEVKTKLTSAELRRASRICLAFMRCSAAEIHRRTITYFFARRLFRFLRMMTRDHYRPLRVSMMH